MERVSTLGRMKEFIKVNGELTKCTGKEHSHGLMVENMSESMLRTKREVMVNSFGLMGGVTEENGSMVNNTVKEHM